MHPACASGCSIWSLSGVQNGGLVAPVGIDVPSLPKHQYPGTVINENWNELPVKVSCDCGIT